MKRSNLTHRDASRSLDGADLSGPPASLPIVHRTDYKPRSEVWVNELLRAANLSKRPGSVSYNEINAIGCGCDRSPHVPY